MADVVHAWATAADLDRTGSDCLDRLRAKLDALAAHPADIVVWREFARLQTRAYAWPARGRRSPSRRRTCGTRPIGRAGSASTSRGRAAAAALRWTPLNGTTAGLPLGA